MISTIVETRLLAVHKQELVGAINDKVWLAYQDPTEEPTPKQGIAEPEVFLTQADWDIMHDPTSSLRDRLQRLAARFGTLGLWYPTEHAVKCVVTLAFLDKGHPSGFMDAALQASRSFKASAKMRRVAHKGPKANLPNFQQSISEFQANHPAWFRAGYSEAGPLYSEAGPLAPVPVPTMMLRNLEAQLGCRNTKRGVKWMQAEKTPKHWLALMHQRLHL